MIANVLMAPGKRMTNDQYGPCIEEDCGHEACALIRKRAATICPYCHNRIGYETPFYFINTRYRKNILVHEKCHNGL